MRRKRKPGAAAPNLLPLTLVAAVYEGGAAVTLTFDRAIDIAGLDGSSATVDDGVFGLSQYAGTAAATLQSPTSVQIELSAIGEWTGPDVRLNVGTGNGIVAVNDGGTWGGVSDLELPFP